MSVRSGRDKRKQRKNKKGRKKVTEMDEVSEASNEESELGGIMRESQDDIRKKGGIDIPPFYVLSQHEKRAERDNIV